MNEAGHLTDEELNSLATFHLPLGQAGTVRDHLAACADCHMRYDAVRKHISFAPPSPAIKDTEDGLEG